MIKKFKTFILINGWTSTTAKMLNYSLTEKKSEDLLCKRHLRETKERPKRDLSQKDEDWELLTNLNWMDKQTNISLSRASDGAKN